MAGKLAAMKFDVTPITALPDSLILRGRLHEIQMLDLANAGTAVQVTMQWLAAKTPLNEYPDLDKLREQREIFDRYVHAYHTLFGSRVHRCAACGEVTDASAVCWHDGADGRSMPFCAKCAPKL